MFDRSKCNLCGDCLVRCQYIGYDKAKAVQQISEIIEGKNAEILRDCITCVGCNEYCPTGADPFDLINELQEKYAALPVSERTRGTMDMAPLVPSEIRVGQPGKPVLSLCIMERLLPADAIQGKLFDELTILKGGDYFCYIGYVHIGVASPPLKNARKFVDNLAATGAKEIVFLHDDCWVECNKKVPEAGVTLPFKPVHVLEYLRNYLKDNKSNISKLNIKIAYQRPCASRYTPEKDSLVDEIFELTGVERVARRHDRENALCCGAAILGVYRERAPKYQEMNIEDALRNGAEAMVTLCPMCYRILSKVAPERGLPVIYITDLCRMALGEKTFPGK